MDVFIPIHYACHVLNDGMDKSHCPVFCDLPNANPTGESYLSLDTEQGGIDFDLKIGNNGGLALTEPALHHAKRLYEDTTLTEAEDYTNRGRYIAQSLHFGAAHEYLAAWMNETRKQSDLIRDFDMVLSLNILRKLPQWIRHDMFLVLEAEAMKQVFATRFFTFKDNAIQLPTNLRIAIGDNAANRTNTVISALMESLFKTPLSYNGTGREFNDKHATFHAEFESI